MPDKLKHRFEIALRFFFTSYYCFSWISGVNNKEKGKFVLEFFIFACKHSFVWDSHTHCRQRFGNTDWKSSLRWHCNDSKLQEHGHGCSATTCTYLLTLSTRAWTPLSLTLVQLASTDFNQWHRAATCKRTDSPINSPPRQRLKFSSWSWK